MEAIEKTHPPQVTRGFTVQIYNQDTPDDQMVSAISTDIHGTFTIKYRNRSSAGTVDMDDPLSMPIARDYGDGVHAGMVIARVKGSMEGQSIDQYRVVFNDGPGYLTDRASVTDMHQLFIDSAPLEPVVVTVDAVVGQN